MKSLLFHSQLFVYAPLFFLLVNISDGKVPAAPATPGVAVATAPVPVTSNQDCTAALKNMNNTLKNDQDGILNEDEVEHYEECLHSVQSGLDFKNNMYDYYFLLDCYTNLMDYYDIVDHNQEKLDEIEDSIEEISVD